MVPEVKTRLAPYTFTTIVSVIVVPQELVAANVKVMELPADAAGIV